MRPGEASAVAERYAQAINVSAHVFAIRRPRTCVPFFLWFGQVATGDMTPPEGLLQALELFERSTPTAKTEIRFTANDVAVLCLWQQHCQVISPDPDLWAELADTRTDMPIPAGLFDQMPYPDPFVAFPEPLVLPLDDGQYMTVGGFFVTGRTGVGLQVETDIHHRVQMPFTSAASQLQPDGYRWYGLLFGAETWNADGTPIYVGDTTERDMVWTRLTIRDGATVDQLLAESMTYFRDSAVGGDAAGQASAMMRAAVSMMVYLCAENRDARVITPPPVIERRKGKPPRRRKSTAPTVVEVGFRVGATIRKYRKERAKYRETNPTGRTMPPHLRAAHFQSFRIGPGRPDVRTQTIVKWVSFIEVNMSKRSDERPTVHRAAKVRTVEKGKVKR